MSDNFISLQDISGELSSLRADKAALQRKVKELESVLNSVEVLMDESDGVCGLHFNGDNAPWSELLEGGRFEEWLIDFSQALNSAKEAV